MLEFNYNREVLSDFLRLGPAADATKYQIMFVAVARRVLSIMTTHAGGTSTFSLLRARRRVPQGS